VIKLNNINKQYTKINVGKSPVVDNAIVALRDVNLEIADRDIFGIIGTSGAGKSTLLRIINKLEQPDSGYVVVNGRTINQLSNVELKTARQEIGMIFQHFNLLNSLNVYQNIVFPLKIHQQLKTLSKAELDARLDSILELTGLTHLVHQYPSQLSGGQKQRVAIARSLITKPGILLCDECTSALDPETTSSILQLLKKINTELGVTIVLITHEMEVIKAICNKVAVMAHGEIVETGSVLDLYTQAQQEATKKLLSRSLINKLPNVILNNIIYKDLHGNDNFATDNNCFPLLQLAFIDDVASKPILSRIVREYNLDFNILQGEIETIQETIVGRLLVQVESEHVAYNTIKQVFDTHNIHVEVIGYAPRIHQ
jgi:D-methionine transport system ATP-binding protein